MKKGKVIAPQPAVPEAVVKKKARQSSGEPHEELSHLGVKLDAEARAALTKLVAAWRQPWEKRPQSAVVRRVLIEAASRLMAAEKS